MKVLSLQHQDKFDLLIVKATGKAFEKIETDEQRLSYLELIMLSLWAEDKKINNATFYQSTHEDQVALAMKELKKLHTNGQAFLLPLTNYIEILRKQIQVKTRELLNRENVCRESFLPGLMY